MARPSSGEFASSGAARSIRRRRSAASWTASATSPSGARRTASSRSAPRCTPRGSPASTPPSWLLAIHRRDPVSGEECGHCVALHWNDAGKVGAFAKSNYPGLGHRDALFADEMAVAADYARAYVGMGFEPLYFGVTTLEEAAGDIDWRTSMEDLSVLSERIQASYAYAFSTAR
jgi:hypothetical protein